MASVRLQFYQKQSVCSAAFLTLIETYNIQLAFDILEYDQQFRIYYTL